VIIWIRLKMQGYHLPGRILFYQFIVIAAVLWQEILIPVFFLSLTFLILKK
jgi:hypothetical protein